jgi:outer membrane protein OmpA-like peptidoglycan-associated protein
MTTDYQANGQCRRKRSFAAGWVAGSPRTRRQARPPVALLSMLLVVGFGLIPSSAAQAQSREILIGTFSTGQTDVSEMEGRAAANLLADALTSLERGDVMLGRRQLDRVVKQYPGTLAAGTAQRELDRYFGQAMAAPGPLRPTANESQQASTDVNVVPPADDALPPRRHPQPDARVQRALAMDFQIIAGDRVFFGEASAALGARSRTVLNAQARWLKAHPSLPVVIEAHADDRGGRELNIALSQRRAEVVRDRLVEEGVTAERISIRAHGRDQPVAACHAAECAAQNRRVVTNIVQDATGASSRQVAPGLAVREPLPWQSRRGD